MSTKVIILEKPDLCNISGLLCLWTFVEKKISQPLLQSAQIKNNYICCCVDGIGSLTCLPIDLLNQSFTGIVQNESTACREKVLCSSVLHSCDKVLHLNCRDEY